MMIFQANCEYLVPLGSSQHSLHMVPLPHSFPQMHDVDGYNSGHNHDFTVSCSMNKPPPLGLSDTYHSVVSHSPNNLHPAMSNHVLRSMNDPPPPSDAYHSMAFHSPNNFHPAMFNHVSHSMNDPPPTSDA
jgi:hypothetical protein